MSYMLELDNDDRGIVYDQGDMFFGLLGIVLVYICCFSVIVIDIFFLILKIFSWYDILYDYFIYKYIGLV